MPILVLIILFIIFYVLYRKPCSHNMIYRGYKACHDEHHNLMYSRRKYQCSNCDCIQWIDTRYGDPFSKV